MDSPGPTKRKHINSVTIQRLKNSSTDRLVAENVTHGSDGVFRCAIAGPGTCPFAMPKMIQFGFASHFLRLHAKEAAEKGFLRGQSDETSQSQPAPLGRFVVKTKRGFCCRIDTNQSCAYTQQGQVSVQSFTDHFCQAHPELARKHGFGNGLRSTDSRKAEPASKKRKLADSEEASPNVFQLNPSDEKVWIDAPSDDASEYCRLCFSVARPFKQIFSNPEDNGSSCATLIEQCTGVRLSAQQDFPAVICNECCEQLHDIKCFRILCETLNRVIYRNRALYHSNTSKVVTEPRGRVTSPPPLVPFDEPITTPSDIELTTENDDEDYFLELSDSLEDEPVEETPLASNTTPVSVEDSDDEDLPYIALQNDFFCCKQCHQIHHTLNVMMDHLSNYHSELAFFARPKPAVPQTIRRKYNKNKSKKNKTCDNQTIVIAGKTYFKCNECDTLLSRKATVIRHWQCYHEGSDPKLRLFCTVPGCSQNFMDKTGLTRHMKLQHTGLFDRGTEAEQLSNDIEVL